MNEVGYKVIVAKHCDGHEIIFMHMILYKSKYTYVLYIVYIHVYICFMRARLLEMYSK